ncbi:hypothetical protein HaLaN_22817, partial [Haematococcus lacustris]
MGAEMYMPTYSDYSDTYSDTLWTLSLGHSDRTVVPLLLLQGRGCVICNPNCCWARALGACSRSFLKPNA